MTNWTKLVTLGINSNQISGPIPAGMASIASTTSLRINNNNFVFSDFEAQYPTYHSYATFVYSPQATVDAVRTVTFNEGDTITITPAVAANANDSYQWYKDSVLISGATSRIFTKANARGTDAGAYSYQITNSVVASLTLTSYSITLNILPQPPTSSSIYYMVNGDDIWTRGKISDTKDLAQYFTLRSTGNQEVDFMSSYIIASSTSNSTSSYVTGTLVGSASDDSTPVSTINIGYLMEGHGLSSPVVTSVGHDKASADIGSTWTDGTYQFILASISGNDLTFYSKSSGSPWIMRNTILGSSLTHVSGATHTGAITITSQAAVQKYPIVKNLVRHVKNGSTELVDGDSGYTDSIDLSEEFDLIDPSTIITTNNPFVWNSSTAVWMHVKNVYHVTAGTTMVHSIYNVESNIDVGYFGFVQVGILPIGSYDKRYYYVPKTKPISGYDFKAIQDLTTLPSSMVRFTDSYLDDTSNPIDRQINLLKNDADSNYDIGFAFGYSRFSGGSRDCAGHSNGCWSIYTSGKSYPVYIANIGEVNNVTYDVYAYRQWLDPKAYGDNKLAYWNNQNGHDVVYIDYHKSVTDDATVLPSSFTNKAFRILESENITAPQSFVLASGVKLSTTGANTYGYAVLELFDDTTAPAGGVLTYPNGYDLSGSVSLTVADGTDSESGVATSSRIVQRKSAPLTNGICGSYGAFTTITPTGTYPNFVDNSVSLGNCYQYHYLVSDNTGNQVIYFSSNEFKFGNAPASGGGLPAWAYNSPSSPTGGFGVSINPAINYFGRAKTTDSRIVTLAFKVGSDVKKMAISMTGDFSDAGQEEYAPTKPWDLCSKISGLIKNPTCPNGDYTVYVKFYTFYGQPSEVVADSITLKTLSKINDESKETSPVIIKKPVVSTIGQLTQNLKFGSNNKQVVWLQDLLKKLGFFPAAIKSNGNFGPATKQAVQKFQCSRRIVCSGSEGTTGYGRVGPKTRLLLNQLNR
jgi:hypothetical protein